MTERPQISDAWIVERWPTEDPAEVRRRFDALMDKLGETPWRGVPRFPDTMMQVLAWEAMTASQRHDAVEAALADVPDHMRRYLWKADKPAFGEQRVKFENVVGDDGHGMGRQAIAITPYIKGYNLAKWIAAASPGNIAALLGELRRLRARIGELLGYNNDQVEKRRAATALLREAAETFRFYEQNHRAKAADFGGTAAEYESIAMSGSSPVSQQWRATEADSLNKAERNAAIATRIEAFLGEIHL